MRMWPRRHKYSIAPRAERTYKGFCYASKAEATRARELDLLKMAGGLVRWDRQIAIQLGQDFKTVVDFVLHYRNGRVRYEEIKGHETDDFKRVRRLWEKYGPGPLHIMKWYGSGWKTEVLQGKGSE